MRPVERQPFAPLAGARVLVFGATGFIGAWVARGLGRHGAQITLAARDPSAAASLAAEIGGAAVIRCDVRDDDAVRATLREVQPQATFNLAGYGVDPAERDDAQALRINAGFVAVLCSAVARWRDLDWNGQALVHAGSQLEYGPLPGELREDAAPHPDTSYGRSKLEGTQAVERMALATGVRMLTARLFTVYGPGERSGRLLPSLIETAAGGGTLALTEGTQRTDFVYVEDTAEGLLRLALSPAAPGATVNLASGRVTTIRAFAEQAAALLGIPADRLRFGALPARPDAMQYDAVSNERLRELAGWTPRTTVAEGIRRTMERQGWTHVRE